MYEKLSTQLMVYILIQPSKLYPHFSMNHQEIKESVTTILSLLFTNQNLIPQSITNMKISITKIYVLCTNLEKTMNNKYARHNKKI